MSRPIRIVPHDPQWPDHYAREHGRISHTLGRRVSVIEHIGSTAVKDLATKPIIDIMAGAAASTTAEDCLRPLAEIGYTEVTAQPEIPDWHYCIARSGSNLSFHLHLVTHPSLHWDRHILFRDYQRRHREAAGQYGELKTRLARECTADRQTYTEGKAAFARRIEGLAHGAGSR